LKKAVNIVFVFEGWAQGFFEVGEFVPLHSAFYLFVCGSYCRHIGSSAAIMEEQNVSSLAVYTRSAQIAEQSFSLAKILHKIWWQAILLIFSLSDNIWVVI
jgi:hypothetical protein